MINILKVTSSFLIVLLLASCGNESSSTIPSKKKQQVVKSEKCQYTDENTPINFYISEKWISDHESCLTPEIKIEIEKKLYSFVKKISAFQMNDNLKYYELLTILNSKNELYKKKVKIYEDKIKKQLKFLAGLYSLTIPSDSAVKYFVLEINGKGSYRTIVTKRAGAAGVSFSKRIYNCNKGTVKYLGSGRSIEEMNSSVPDPKMSAITNKSIAYYLQYHACKNLG